VRSSGPDFFVDLHVTMDGQTPLQNVHALMDKIEQTIQEIVPGADVDVHPEPAGEMHPDHD
jgi:ferrous-iron efflux pump FieF